ncbi:cysteine rich repeat-containing protein [Phyllobacterium sp. KW56]|nr:cysteine rich repeat-containing protein [Phyllobacterium sp. KW56]
MAQTAAERAACMADFQKYCPGVMPGGGRVIECLAKQLDKLTPECKKVVQSHAPK